jgi:hypothetical protein
MNEKLQGKQPQHPLLYVVYVVGIWVGSEMLVDMNFLKNTQIFSPFFLLLK